MRTIFTTEDTSPRTSFQRWRETIFDRIVPVEQSRLEDRPFEGRIQAANVASLPITRVWQGALRTEVTKNTIRKDPRSDGLSVIVKLGGLSSVSHFDRVSAQKPGDLLIVDRNRPALLTSDGDSSSYLLELPRKIMEDGFGRSVNYAGLNIDGDLPSAILTRRFFDNLVLLHGSLDAAAAERMAAIGVDLLVATVAERLARDPPGPVQATLTVQRAKAYVRAHLGQPSLDPHGLAAAMGLSTRRLHELFQERGHGISEWIWDRRRDAAARLLRDPGHGHLTIGEIARNCGYSSQPHFSRTFRDRFGVTPREYRAGVARP